MGNRDVGSIQPQANCQLVVAFRSRIFIYVQTFGLLLFQMFSLYYSYFCTVFFCPFAPRPPFAIVFLALGAFSGYWVPTEDGKVPVGQRDEICFSLEPDSPEFAPPGITFRGHCERLRSW